MGPEVVTGIAFPSPLWLTEAVTCNRSATDDVKREMEVLNLVSDHENVAALKATYEDKENVYFVLVGLQ
jgi:hypothetical protein